MGITIPPGQNCAEIDLKRRGSVEDLVTLALTIAANKTPGLLDRWVDGMIIGGVLCPFGCTWERWLAGVRAGELGKLPWE